jgi:hypothetical protein
MIAFSLTHRPLVWPFVVAAAMARLSLLIFGRNAVRNLQSAGCVDWHSSLRGTAVGLVGIESKLRTLDMQHTHHRTIRHVGYTHTYIYVCVCV